MIIHQEYAQLCTTRYSISNAKRYQNIKPGHYVMAVITETPHINNSTEEWRTSYKSGAVAFSVYSQNDTISSFSTLASSLQRSCNIAPYAETCVMDRAGLELEVYIKVLDELEKMVDGHYEQ